MGPLTGLVLDYLTKNKRCSGCELLSRAGAEIITEHNCRKNHVGSSKAMEGDAAVTLFKMRMDTNTQYGILIADDDSTTIAWIHEEVDELVDKLSDINHSCVTCKKKLLAIKSKHPSLTHAVIDYIKACFACAIGQNKNNTAGLKSALNAIVPHMYGEHEKCDISWCRYIQKLGPNLPDCDTEYKHKYFGEDLTCPKLRKDLDGILSHFAEQAHKLSPQGSSQRNEALNNIIIRYDNLNTVFFKRFLLW